MRALVAGALLGGAALGFCKKAGAEQAPPPVLAAAPAAEQRGPYVHTFATLGYGRGLRLNNPFRLQTELGDDGESLSLTAGYLDFAAGGLLGNPNGLQHGAVAHWSLAAQGIGQHVLSLSYLVAYPVTRDLLGYARAGVPVVLTPDVSTGGELALGAAFLVTSGLGLSAELVSSLFFGAATWEHDPNMVPVLSLQVGAWVDYEVLP